MNHELISTPNSEAHYFDSEVNFAKGHQWYTDRLSENISESTRLYGEKTPSYCYMESCASRIKSHNPDVKLIWILRNPVDRAYSHYMHAVKKNTEFHSFEKALQLESNRLGKDDHLAYLDRSNYIKYVKIYLKYFDMEQMLFLKFEELQKESNPVVKEMFEFLGLSMDKFVFKDEVINPTLIPRFTKLLYILRSIVGKNSSIYDLARSISLRNKAPGYPPMNVQTRKWLVNYFKPLNEELNNLIGFDIAGYDR